MAAVIAKAGIMNVAGGGGNILELLKAQLLLNQKDNMISGFVILMLFEFFTGFLREFIKLAKTWFDSYLKKNVKKRLQNTIVTRALSKTSELFFERDYEKTDNWDKADAILHQVLEIPESQTVLVIGQLEVIKNGQEFPITEHINFQLLNLKLKDEDCIDHISFKISSDKLTVCQLRDYTDTLVEQYIITKKNNLGNKLFFFDHIVEKQLRGAPTLQKVKFSKHYFVTNRNLDNVFHEQQETLKHRLDFFLKRKDWYDQRGIPHTLGLLLYGCPGTGKTSTIKAIANIAKRHIININLSAIQTKKQLKKLFYDEHIEVCKNLDSHQTETFIIPINKRLYVIEDIDCLEGDIVLKRSEKDKQPAKPARSPPAFDNGPRFSHELPPEDLIDLDLSTILNIMDGTLETPGRILIISSNHPEKLDEAFIRPGRIDMIIEYKKCNKQVLRDMFYSFYSQEPADESLEQIDDYKWTPAEVSQILFKNFDTPDQALDDLIKLRPERYFKFSHIEGTGESLEITPVSSASPISNTTTTISIDSPPGSPERPATEIIGITEITGTAGTGVQFISDPNDLPAIPRNMTVYKRPHPCDASSSTLALQQYDTEERLVNENMTYDPDYAVSATNSALNDAYNPQRTLLVP